MTDLTHIESLGIELPKGREYACITEDAEDMVLTKDFMDDVLCEAYAVIERLVGERDTAREEARRWDFAAHEATKMWMLFAHAEPTDFDSMASYEAQVERNLNDIILARYQPEEEKK